MGKGLTRLRTFRIDRKGDGGERDMNRPDVTFGVERDSSGKMRRRKGKGGEKKWQVYQGEATIRDGDGGEEDKAGVGDGVEIFQGEMRRNAGEGEARIGGEEDGVESDRTWSRG